MGIDMSDAEVHISPESMVQDTYEPELTTARAEELDCRLAAHEKNPDDVVTWEMVKADLESKY
jgi:putative addiction module component (TIGR02574 family)